MPKFERIDGSLRDFIETQKVFFVATAAPEGRVNVAPKGMDTLYHTNIFWPLRGIEWVILA